MTTALYKLIFNAVQHQACQTVVQDVDPCKITHFPCLIVGNIIHFFLFFILADSSPELSHQPVPFLQPILLCKSH